MALTSQRGWFLLIARIGAAVSAGAFLVSGLILPPLVHEPKPNAAQEPQHTADTGGEVDRHAEHPASLHKPGNHTYRPGSSDSETTTPVNASETARASRDSVMPSTTTNPDPPSTSRTAVPPPSTTSEVSPTSAPPSVPETTRPDGSTERQPPLETDAG